MRMSLECLAAYGRVWRHERRNQTFFSTSSSVASRGLLCYNDRILYFRDVIKKHHPRLVSARRHSTLPPRSHDVIN